jgi:hypothetical protein
VDVFKTTTINEKTIEEEHYELKEKAQNEHRTCSRTKKVTGRYTEGRFAAHTAVNGRNFVSKKNTISQQYMPIKM